MAIPLLVAAGFQIISGLQQSEMIKNQSRLTQLIAERNARYAEMDAWEAEKYGISQAARYDSVIEKTIGDQRVGFAAQNVDVNSGTAMAVQEETKLTGFLNMLDLQKNARAKAFGLKVEASNIRLGGYMAGLQSNLNADAAVRGGVLSGINTGLSGYRVGSTPRSNADTDYESK